MDPVSAGTAAWSIFNACYQVYQVVSEAIELNAEARRWDVQVRVERVRFEVWGRTLGFVDEKTGSPKDLGAKDLTTSGLNSILEVEAANLLICDLLNEISLALSKFQEAAEKYSLEATPKPDKPEAAAKDQALPKASRHDKAAENLSRMWKSTKIFTKHTLYVLVDKGSVEELLRQLTSLNDSLEKLLTLSQKVQYTKAITSGVLVAYQSSSEIEALLTTAESRRDGAIFPPVLVASARVKQLCITIAAEERTPEAQDSCFRFRLPSESVQGYRIPHKAKLDHLWPVDTATYLQDNHPPVTVLLEWRSRKPSAPRFAQDTGFIDKRRDHVVGLLQKTSRMTGAGDYRILDCIGYLESEGREDGQKASTIGFISRYPAWADGQKSPVTMHSLITDAFNSQDIGVIPSLRTRFNLARYLANALYQLQCSNWLHRNLSSHQIVFFHDKKTGHLLLDQPYLIGFQYSRPDDNVRTGQEDEYTATEGFVRNENLPELYLPPILSEPQKFKRRYRRSDDVYSLGIMLFEIAFWEPVQVLYKQGDRAWDVEKRIHETLAAELASETGELYRDAVLSCLQGLRNEEEKPAASDSSEGESNEDEDDGKYYRGEDPEFGLEVDFLWRVLREIEKCTV